MQHIIKRHALYTGVSKLRLKATKIVHTQKVCYQSKWQTERNAFAG